MNVWQLIDKTKDRGRYTDPQIQEQRLYKILCSIEEEEILELQKQWDFASYMIPKIEDYIKVHWSEGGFINGADDSLYMDFPDWVMAQGKELYSDIIKNGVNGIFEYIKRNNIDTEDCDYENISYDFNHALEFIKEGNSYE